MVHLINDFTLVCEKTKTGETAGNFCACDFRINIYGCTHNEFYIIAGKILITICILLTIMSSGSLIYLIKAKKQPFFLPAASERGWLRPRPLHSYHLIVLTYAFFETFHMIALINELYPNVIAAELGNILTNTVSASVAIFYTISIVYSTPNVHFNENSEPLGRNDEMKTRLIDTIGIILFLLPIVTWFPLAFLTGYYAEMNNIKLADIFFTIHYLAFVVWGIVYLITLICFWYRLMTVIKSYVKVLEERYVSSGSRSIDECYIESIKQGARNITLPVMVMSCGLFLQAIIFVAMSLTHRTITIYYLEWDIFYYCIEYVALPLFAFCAESISLYFTIIDFIRSRNFSSNLSSTSSQTRVDTDTDLENNNERRTFSALFLRRSYTAKPTPSSPTIIHYTSEVITLIEDNVDIIEGDRTF